MRNQQTLSEDSVIIVNGRKDLEELLEKRRVLFARSPRVDIHLEFLGAYPQRRRYYEKRLSMLYTDCGCSWGAALILIFISAYISSMIIGITGPLGPVSFLLGILLFVFSAVLGKIFGLLLARHRFKRTISNIYKELGNYI